MLVLCFKEEDHTREEEKVGVLGGCAVAKIKHHYKKRGIFLANESKQPKMNGVLMTMENILKHIYKSTKNSGKNIIE